MTTEELERKALDTLVLAGEIEITEEEGIDQNDTTGLLTDGKIIGVFRLPARSIGLDRRGNLFINGVIPDACSIAEFISETTLQGRIERYFQDSVAFHGLDRNEPNPFVPDVIVLGAIKKGDDAIIQMEIKAKEKP